MDYLGLAVGYAVAALLLFAVGRYFYLNVRQGRLWIALRNFLFLFAVLAAIYYLVNSGLIHPETCGSYDIRGCTE